MEGTTTLLRPQVFQAVLGSWFQSPWPLAFNAGPIAETRVTADGKFMREGVPLVCYHPERLENFSPPPAWLPSPRPSKAATSSGCRWWSMGRTSPASPSRLRIARRPYPASSPTLAGRTEGRPACCPSLRPSVVAAAGSLPAVATAIPAAQTRAYIIPDLPPGQYLVAAVGLEMRTTGSPRR